MESVYNNISSADLAEQKQKQKQRKLRMIGKLCEVLSLSILFLTITGLFCIPTIVYALQQVSPLMSIIGEFPNCSHVVGEEGVGIKHSPNYYTWHLQQNHG